MFHLGPAAAASQASVGLLLVSVEVLLHLFVVAVYWVGPNEGLSLVPDGSISALSCCLNFSASSGGISRIEAGSDEGPVIIPAGAGSGRR